MNVSGGFLRAASVLSVSGVVVLGVVMSPGAWFEVNPGNPSARSEVRFVDRSTGGAASSWLWTFGDGHSSTLQNPTHVYEAAGTYPVSLWVANASGATETTSMVEVAQEETLRLLAQTGNAFEVTLVAVNPNPGGVPPTEQARAIPQNDVFGYFTFPLLVPTAPGAPLVPEVFVKMLDARSIGSDFWVFWGGLTTLEYTLTVRDTVRGTVKTYHNPVTDIPGCLSADISGFATGATPTPTVTATSPTPTPTPPAGSVRVVNVGQGGNQFVDGQGGGKQTTIRVGDTVQWNWAASSHSSTSGECTGNPDPYYGGPACEGSGEWDSGTHLAPFQYAHTFLTPGTYNYFCGVHGSAMTGRVVVQAQ